MGIKKPKDWNKFSSKTNIMDGAPFVAFKTPIDDQGWNLRTLVNRFPDLSLIIDLNATDRYYKAQAINRIKPGLRIVKIPTAGLVIPNQAIVQEFRQEVDGVLEQNENALIGVICTYGNNRAGYMICRYLIEQEGWDPQLAIDEFENARGYGIERPHYLTNLQNLVVQESSEESDDDLINNIGGLNLN